MPIKFPKFARRKSSGNAYEPANVKDDREGAGEGSGSGSGGFRVLPQPSRVNRAATNSTYSGSDEYAGSNRLSSSSTLPSADNGPRTPDEFRPPFPHTKTAPAVKGGAQHYGYPTAAGHNNATRMLGGMGRSRTETLSSTLAPKLETSLDTSSLFDEDMFNFNGPKKPADDPNTSGGAGSLAPNGPKIASNRVIDSNRYDHAVPPIPPPKSYNPNNMSSTPLFAPEEPSSPYNMFASPEHMDSDRPGSDSPYHWNQEDKPREPTNAGAKYNSRTLTPTSKPAAAKHTRVDSLEAPPNRPAPRQPKETRTNGASRRSQYVDQDAAIVANSRTHRSTPSSAPLLQSQAGGKDGDSGWEESIPSSRDDSLKSESSKDTTLTSPMLSRGTSDDAIKTQKSDASTTPKPAADPYADEDDFDASLAEVAGMVANFQVTSDSPKLRPQTKVMTKAQFESYQKQQEEHRRLGGRSEDSDDDADSFVSEDEEESEAERRRQAAKQRERQEAHLSVYRQQMMKITGSTEAPLGMQSRPASMSTSALDNRHSMLPSVQEPDEDEDIPLGILAAHGFPSKNRPPTRLSSSNSQPNLRQSAMMGADPHLPVFARNLPADPYNVGAGLVNPLNRQSLAFHNGPSDARSVAGGSVYGGSVAPPGRGPGGLVGEIVKAEEQRAARKGLSNPNAHRDVFAPSDPFRSNSLVGGMGMGPGPGSVPPSPQHGGMLGMGGGMNAGMGAMNAATEAMQAQMHTQMQMMQMQMQWMQMQMQPQQQQQQFLNPMGPPMPQQRPNSVMLGGMNGQPMGGGLSVPQMPQRPMSMMDPQFQVPGSRSSYSPSVAPSRRGSMIPPLPPIMGTPLMGMQPGYTPSIAPSERSNVGLPPRYRPVSQHTGQMPGQRTSTLSSGIGHDWQRKAATSSHLKNAAITADEEDDEAGWEELSKKRKEKKEKKKKEAGFKGILNFGSSTAAESD